jgi:DNA-binding transcriptional LysR family regulator
VADDTDLNWDDLRYFLLAARAGTLAGAARSSGVQHTTIGRRLSALERSFGAPLLLRSPDGLSLTPLGEQLLPLVADVERHVLAVRERAAAQRGRVRVALPSGFIGLFADELVQLRAAHPEVILETVSGGQLLDLQRGEAELAVRLGPIDDESLVARSLGEVGWSLYASPRYLKDHSAPAQPEALHGHKVIAYGADLASMPAAQWLERHAADAVLVLRTNEMATMLEAAKSGAGMAVLPCMLADDDPALVRLTPKVLASRALSLVYRREVRLNESVRVVVNFLVDVMRGHAVRLAGVREDCGPAPG